jgi:hypothetical protein
MSEASIHAIHPPQTSCFNRELACRALKQCHRLEVAALITAATLIILACLAFSQTGTFAGVSYAITFGLCCLTFAGGVIGGELIYKAIVYCKLKSKYDPHSCCSGAPKKPSPFEKN